ncbi:MAG: hypothetical protein NC177_17885, partial [Ruminococcus flavefaciens]|nr:hypothetical protein [Ruminococcus flavefaciens]
MYTVCLDAFGNSVRHLTQWDTNQSLLLNNSENLTTAPLFHFYNQNCEEALVVNSNFTDDSKNVIEVKVPNVLLQESLPINVFMYAYSDESSGQSIAEFRIHVHERVRPSSYTYVENIDEYSVNGVETVLRNDIKAFEEKIESEINGFIRFDKAQTLTDEQKKTARNNINTVGKRCSDTAESFNDYRERGQAVDENSITVITGNQATGDYSHAEGTGTTANGYSSHAEGGSTEADNNYSHAEGFKTIASGDYSHSEGSNTVASGESSHAEGTETQANNSDSHAEGYRTV